MLEASAVFLVITALLARLNHRFIGLPMAIGTIARALTLLLLIVGLDAAGFARELREREDLPLLGLHLPLISPIDPIAVMGILAAVQAPKDLELVIAGESLFNDGVGGVIFTLLLGACHRCPMRPSGGICSWPSTEPLAGSHAHLSRPVSAQQHGLPRSSLGPAPAAAPCRCRGSG